MSSLIQITLGIITAIGGFVDIGELVFSVQAGVKYGYTLLWAVLLGTIGIIIFSEQAGRIAAVYHKPVFTLVKEKFPQWLSLTILIASMILNVITCAAEVGGVAIVLQLLTGLAHLPALLLTVGLLIILIWILPFKYLEKIFGILGIAMIIFVVAVIDRHVSYSALAQGLIPTLPHYNLHSSLIYLYIAVGIISSSMMPYEVYFYSSGGIEEKWSKKDLFNNKMTSVVGMSLGAFISASLLILGANILKPLSITPQLHGTSVLLSAIPFGQIGLIIALLGIFFAIAGAAVETSLAGAYNLAQYFNWDWGVRKDPTTTPRFTLSWVLIFAFAFIVLLFNIDPVELVEYAVIFSLLALPFTYYLILKVSSDKKVMKNNTTGRLGKVLGWAYFWLICLITLISVPLMLLTNQGKG